MFRRSNQIKMFTWKDHWPITKYKQVFTHKGTHLHMVQSVLVILSVDNADQQSNILPLKTFSQQIHMAGKGK